MATKRFQSTFPHGERHAEYCPYDFSKVGFNPRSRTGNDELNILKIFLKIVSIHVPARGTTDDEADKEFYNYVSIHVPARGTTILF